ncbi:MAG: ASPIC/UnbV domain-containing protein, partial [Flavobacteriales bacterium]|nr:ASPIC/UnbV domain-containing protein [Flavobacteriales bacterium]
NDNGTFTDVTVGSGLDTHTGLSTEWTTHDFNNDGRLDILGGGALYIGTGDLTFELAVNVGNHAIGDLNDDGYLDILGGTSIRYNNGGAMNWLKVHTVGTVSNGNGIGARILVTTPLGTQIREVRSGDGFRYMSSLMAHFGLGNDEVIEEVRVLWPSGLTNVYTDVDINSTFTAVESPSTAVETDAEEALFAVYPNPAQDHLLLGLNAGVAVDITLIDARGSVVYQGRPVDMTVDVSGLLAGLYTVRAQFEGTTRTARFTKL